MEMSSLVIQMAQSQYGEKVTAIILFFLMANGIIPDKCSFRFSCISVSKKIKFVVRNAHEVFRS